MNDSPEDSTTPPPMPEENPATDSTSEPEAFEETRDAYRDLGDAVKKAFQAGSNDAKKAAKNAVPKAGEEFAKGLHDIAYGVAYLAAFSAEMAKELTPDPVCDGFSEGTDAGRTAAESMREKRRQNAEDANDSPADADPGGPTIVPVV